MNGLIKENINCNGLNDTVVSKFQKKCVIITRKTEMTKVLHAIGMKSFRISRIDQLVIKADERYSVSLLGYNDDKNTYSEILVDFHFGSPTWEQFIDVTYNVDSKYDKRIIVFEYDLNGNTFPDIPDAVCEIESLVRQNNGDGLDTYLVEAKGLINYLSNIENNHIHYYLLDGPYGYDKDNTQRNYSRNHEERPKSYYTKKEILLFEFWNGYFRQYGGMKIINYDCQGLDMYPPRHLLSHDFVASVDWKDDGLFIYLKYDNNDELEGDNILRWIWSTKRSILSERYPEKSISIVKENYDAPIIISIRISNTPVTELNTMEPTVKWQYCELICAEGRILFQLYEDFIKEYFKKDNAVR